MIVEKLHVVTSINGVNTDTHAISVNKFNARFSCDVSLRCSLMSALALLFVLFINCYKHTVGGFLKIQWIIRYLFRKEDIHGNTTLFNLDFMKDKIWKFCNKYLRLVQVNALSNEKRESICSIHQSKVIVHEKYITVKKHLGKKQSWGLKQPVVSNYPKKAVASITLFSIVGNIVSSMLERL